VRRQISELKAKVAAAEVRWGLGPDFISMDPDEDGRRDAMNNETQIERDEIEELEAELKIGDLYATANRLGVDFPSEWFTDSDPIFGRSYVFVGYHRREAIRLVQNARFAYWERWVRISAPPLAVAVSVLSLSVAIISMTKSSSPCVVITTPVTPAPPSISPAPANPSPGSTAPPQQPPRGTRRGGRTSSPSDSRE
jgi:hypothetical protein